MFSHFHAMVSLKSFQVALWIYFIWMLLAMAIDLASADGVVSPLSEVDDMNTSATARTHQWKSSRQARRHGIKKPITSRHHYTHHQMVASSKIKRPNIVLILTDDQDVELGSVNFMRETSRILQGEGAEFRHAYTTTPMCCPSRSSLLTGLYVHNHNVYTNNDNCSSSDWQTAHESRSFATYLSNAGYHTGYFGKYLNKYNGSYTPPGWKEWGGLIMNSKYYNYSVNMNGKRIRHGNDYYKDYYPDLVANDSLNFLQQWKQQHPNKPALLVASFPAPHGPEDSAPQYSQMFFNVTSHHTPSYDYAPNPDKQWILQVTGQMLPIHKEFTNLLMTKRLQTLQSVDNAVKKIYEELKSLRELENTYIIYTSDHGYHLGQFGLIKGKSFPFEFDIRVPFLVRGPGIDPGTIVQEVALNIDLAPTFLDIAGLPTPSHMDGRSLLKLFHKRKKNNRKFIAGWPDTFLIESSGRRESFFEETDILSQHTLLQTRDENSPLSGEFERNLTNILNSKPSAGTSSVKMSSSATNAIPELVNSFVQTFDDENMENGLSVDAVSNKAERLALACHRPEYATPCKTGQKWHCIFQENRWRKHKCRGQSLSLDSLPHLRKCTCITDDGIIYTRFKTSEDNDPRFKTYYRNPASRNSEEFHPTITHFLRSNKSSDELVDELAKTWQIMRRHRRHTSEEETLLSDHVTSVMDVIHGQMLEFRSFNNGTNNATCVILYDGTINCAHEIYDDPTLWEASQKNVFAQIQKLQAQLEKLKDIQRHLKEKRPVTVKSSLSIKEDDLSSSIEESDTSEEIDDASRTKIIISNITSGSESNDTNRYDKFQEPNNSWQSNNSSDSVRSLKSIESNSTIVPQVSNHRHRHQHNVFKNQHQHSFVNNNGEFSTPQTKISTHNDVTLKIKKKLSHKENKMPENYLSNNNSLPDTCYCIPHDSEENYIDEKVLLKEQKRRIKEQKLKKKQRKLKRRAKLEKECYLEKMNCFNHDNSHWRTPPYWTGGPFCFCMNANNNTYTCLRTINSTHNFLYCEFITGLVTFYNLRIDPFQQWNRFNTLTLGEKSWLKNTLADIMKCKGTQECTSTGGFRTSNHMSDDANAKRKYASPDRANKKKPNTVKRGRISMKKK